MSKITGSSKYEAAALLREMATKLPDQYANLTTRACKIAERLEGRPANIEALVARRVARTSCRRAADRGLV